jgi:hypothetical protein
MGVRLSLSLFIYDKKTRALSQSQETNLPSHEIAERRDLEKWVMSSPQILGEDLLIVTNEYDKFDKTKERLDLLALDRDGKLVVIELKREESGRNVELQAVKYAAYCSTLTTDQLVPLRRQFLDRDGKTRTDEQIKSQLIDFISNDDFEELDDKPRIMLVAQDFRPEVTASVLWLRKFDLDISCVRLVPYEIDHERIGIVSSILIPLPEAEDYIISSEKKESTEAFSRTRQEYLEFYTEIRDMMKKEIPEIRLPEPQPLNYYQIPVGIGGVHFEFAFHGRPRNSFGVELHFERRNADENKTMLRNIAEFQSEIEKQTGEPVVTQENWGNTWSRLYLVTNEGAMTEELKRWAVEKMVLFYRVLEPKLARLRTA